MEALASEPARDGRRRLWQRMRRPLSRSRWEEYGRLLEGALERGYALVPFEDFLSRPAVGEAQLVLRHDVDQCPRSAVAMAEIEAALGVRSTWYFRWRTADPRIVERIRASGGSVGLHYETLTRRVLELGGDADVAALVPECRERLRDEVAAFAGLFGPTASMCAHGDSRVPGVRNTVLVRDLEPASFGVEHDADESLRGRRPALWMTDRAAADGGWRDDLDPDAALAKELSPILCLTHPNHWVSGLGLSRDRLLASALPVPEPGRRVKLVRTRGDRPPPTPAARTGSPPR